MCCIFTCCGWMIDLIQRVWTFAMACCISSAICCVLVAASLSGIALGYNYSLAEYIDLKETNVSVYLKRGVFDDEIADDSDFRRAGRLPVAGHIKEDNLMTGAPEGEEQPLRSGRRLDDSVFDSGGDHNQFEGSLLKLTAKPLDAPITPVTYTPDDEMASARLNNEGGPIDKMKVVQEVLNKRRFQYTSTTINGRRRMNDVSSQTQEQYTVPLTPYIWPDVISGRRFNPYDPNLIKEYQSTVINPARTAVPPRNIGGDEFWKIPFLATSTRAPTLGLYDNMRPRTLPTRPRPIKFDWDPIRPSSEGQPRRMNTPGQGRVITVEKIPEAETAKSAEEFDRIGKKLDDLQKSRQRVGEKMAGEEYYDLEPKGVPSRKKRRTVSTKFPDIFNPENGRKTQNNEMDVKGFPNRYKREIVNSPKYESSLNFDKLNKFSDVFNSVTATKIYKNDIKGILSRKKRQIVSSFSTVPSTFVKLSKSSDVFNTETVPKLYENNVDSQEISNGKKVRYLSNSKTISSTSGKLGKSSDVFNTETVPKLYKNDVDNQQTSNWNKRQIIFNSSTTSSTFGKLSKSSDVFNIKTIPKLYENNFDAQENSKGKKRQVVSSSSTIPSTFGKLSKSSDVFNTENVPRYQNDAEEITNENKEKVFSSSSTILSTFDKLSKSSDVFNTKTVPKLENDINAKTNTNKRKISSSPTSSNDGKLNRSSYAFNTETAPKMYDSHRDAQKIPSEKIKRTVSNFGTILSNLDKTYFSKGIQNLNDNVASVSNTFHTSSKSSNVLHTERVYNKDISRRSKIFRSGSIRQNSKIIFSTTFSTIFGKQQKMSDGTNLESKGIASSQNNHIDSSSPYSSNIIDKLSKKSELSQTEIVPYIVKNYFDAKDMNIRKTRRIRSVSSYFPTSSNK